MSQVVFSPNHCGPDLGDDVSFDVPDEALFSAETQQAAFERLRGWADRLDASTITYPRVDLRLGCANARIAHEAFVPFHARARDLAEVDIRLIEELGSIAAALLFAQRRVDLVAPKAALAPRLSRARTLRFILLHQAWAAAGAGLLPEKTVERIAKGSGAIDAAEDLVALAALFDQHKAVLCNRSVVDEAMLQEAARLGSELQTELKPAALPVRKPTEKDERAEAIELRNRFFTLLVLAHKETKRVADFLGIGDRIPSLQSRKALKKKTPNPPATAEG